MSDLDCHSMVLVPVSTCEEGCRSFAPAVVRLLVTRNGTGGGCRNLVSVVARGGVLHESDANLTDKRSRPRLLSRATKDRL